MFGLTAKVSPPLQKMRCVMFRDPFMPNNGPLPAPHSNETHPFSTNRRVHKTKAPDPTPFDRVTVPLRIAVSLSVNGASID